jgi:hypothetical protein
MYSSLSPERTAFFTRQRLEVVAKEQNPNGFASQPWQYPPLYRLFRRQPNVPQEACDACYRKIGPARTNVAFISVPMENDGPGQPARELMNFVGRTTVRGVD